MVLSFAVTLPEDMPKKKQRKGKGKTSSQSKLNAKGNRVSIPEECLEAPLFILKKLLRESASTNLIYCLQQQAGQGRKSYPSPNPPHSHTAGEHVQSRKHTHTHTHTHARTHTHTYTHTHTHTHTRTHIHTYTHIFVGSTCGCEAGMPKAC